MGTLAEGGPSGPSPIARLASPPLIAGEVETKGAESQQAMAPWTGGSDVITLNQNIFMHIILHRGIFVTACLKLDARE